jgi:hypothetical protein
VDEPLVRVRVVDVPVEVMHSTRWHHAELLRELALVGGADPGSVPARLLALSALLRDRYAAFTEHPNRVLEEALARGEALATVDFMVPPDIGAAALELDALLDDADSYCRTGQLLTLAASPEVLRFRRWFLREFARQVEGGEPIPWREAAHP